MSTFLAVFFAIYTSMHALVFARARAILPDRWPVRLSVVLFCLLMILAPAAVRLLERSGHEVAARVTAFIGYSWMGFIFLAFSGVLVLSLFELGAKLVSLMAGTGPLPLSHRSLASGVLAVAALLSVYGLFEARMIRVERVRIATDKLPAGMDRLKVVQVSDVHLGLIMRGERLNPIVERIIQENPDILVSTGDLVDGDMGDAVGEISDYFTQIKPRFGKFAILGNHEYYAGLSYSTDSTERFGFRLLRD
ncbi:MAG: metallophosphoesterase, partial [Acidobacteriota bacterium]